MAVAFVNAAVLEIANTDLFTWNFQVLFPVGAGVLAIGAASGFHFGMKFFGGYAGKIDLVFMLTCSIAFFFLIYFAEYVLLATNIHGRMPPFLYFLSHSVTDARYVFHGSNDPQMNGITPPIG